MGEIVKYPDPPHTEGEGWRAVVASIDSMRDEIGKRHVENTSSIETVEKKVNVLFERVDDLVKGFPEGDWDGHRRYHEAVILKIESRAKFYDDLRAELAKKGLWALIIGVATAVWFYLKSKFNS